MNAKLAKTDLFYDRNGKKKFLMEKNTNVDLFSYAIQ